jgi:predicted transcriptional regulator
MTMISIRVSRDTHERLRHLADQQDRPMSSIAEEAVRAYEKEQRWRAAEAAMARLQADPEAWADYMAESAAWDGALTDGLDELPYEPDAVP